jgi:hypothetical protein
VIHGCGKVHKKQQRDVDLCAEATVREANACRLNELGRRGLMRVVIHKKSPGIADEDVQPVAND